MGLPLYLGLTLCFLSHRSPTAICYLRVQFCPQHCLLCHLDFSISASSSSRVRVEEGRKVAWTSNEETVLIVDFRKPNATSTLDLNSI